MNAPRRYAQVYGHAYKVPVPRGELLGGLAHLDHDVRVAFVDSDLTPDKLAGLLLNLRFHYPPKRPPGRSEAA